MLMMANFIQSIDPGSWLTATSILVSVILFIIANAIEVRKNRIITQREIYQNLELASIGLFQFEANHRDLTHQLWDGDENVDENKLNSDTVFINYISQILCLFEMALNFRKQKIMPPEVFASWVMWYYELCEAPIFRKLWGILAYNYSCDLRQIISQGICIIEKNDDHLGRKKEFFQYIAKSLNCMVVEKWLDCDSDDCDTSTDCQNCAVRGSGILKNYGDIDKSWKAN